MITPGVLTIKQLLNSEKKSENANKKRRKPDSYFQNMRHPKQSKPNNETYQNELDKAITAIKRAKNFAQSREDVQAIKCFTNALNLPFDHTNIINAICHQIIHLNQIQEYEKANQYLNIILTKYCSQSNDDLQHIIDACKTLRQPARGLPGATKKNKKYRELIETHSSQLARSYCSQGDERCQKKKYLEAAQFYSDAMKLLLFLNPDTIDDTTTINTYAVENDLLFTTALKHGKCCYMLLNTTAALKLFGLAKRLRPQNQDALFGIYLLQHFSDFPNFIRRTISKKLCETPTETNDNLFLAMANYIRNTKKNACIPIPEKKFSQLIRNCRDRAKNTTATQGRITLLKLFEAQQLTLFNKAQQQKNNEKPPPEQAVATFKH
jgi:tetratricopeptide (TPR) repeat protein